MMEQRKKTEPVCRLVISIVIAVMLLLLADGILVFSGASTPLPAAVGVLVVLAVLLYILCGRYQRLVLKAVSILLTVLAVLSAAGFGCWSWFSRNGHYLYPDSGKHQLYGDRRVMVIVPHQDDELNILGGVMEEYVRYGSTLSCVFITNGDYYGRAEDRYREALSVLAEAGVPAECVIFLGYGDGWQEGGPHIYNAAPGEVVTSHYGQTQTYGTQVKSAYREERDYTIDNLKEDLKCVILEHRPDVVFCSDYDHHADHKATTLLFDKVMGQILKETPEYHPVVYKAYAYGTAWEAEADYYAENVLSTRNLFKEPYCQQPAVYHWEDRMRFPVNGAALSRSLVGSRGYEQLSLYESQDAAVMAASILNGDKVAWRRYTDSLCLSAQIKATSGDGDLVNDFMLIENHDLTDEERMPYDGVWIPDQADEERSLTVTLEEAASVDTLVLYDHPSLEDNVLNALISFDDGSSLETGPLDTGGAATRIPVEKENLRSFTVSLLETEGSQPGLSELEAFAQKPSTDGCFVKLTDMEGNFLYDCRTALDGTLELFVYTCGALPAVTAENYTVGTAWDKDEAVLDHGVVRIFCPAGESFVLNITCQEAGVSDSILIRNPGRAERAWQDLWQSVEQAAYTRISRGDHNRLLIFSIPEKIGYLLRHL